MSLICFYLSALIAIVSTVMVVTRRNGVHALLYLVVSFLALATIMYELGAPFIAALEVIVYAGAIMVLFVFVMMLLNLGPGSTGVAAAWTDVGIWGGPALLAAVLLVELLVMVLPVAAKSHPAGVVGAKEVGVSLFGPYLLAVELASLLLLAGLVAAFHLGRYDDDAREGRVR